MWRVTINSTQDFSVDSNAVPHVESNNVLNVQRNGGSAVPVISATPTTHSNAILIIAMSSLLHDSPNNR
jgi:hypothetical protein